MQRQRISVNKAAAAAVVVSTRCTSCVCTCAFTCACNCTQACSTCFNRNLLILSEVSFMANFISQLLVPLFVVQINLGLRFLLEINTGQRGL